MDEEVAFVPPAPSLPGDSPSISRIMIYLFWNYWHTVKLESDYTRIDIPYGISFNRFELFIFVTVQCSINIAFWKCLDIWSKNVDITKVVIKVRSSKVGIKMTVWYWNARNC